MRIVNERYEDDDSGFDWTTFLWGFLVIFILIVIYLLVRWYLDFGSIKGRGGKR